MANLNALFTSPPLDFCFILTAQEAYQCKRCAVPAVVLEQESDVVKVYYCDSKACSCGILFHTSKKWHLERQNADEKQMEICKEDIISHTSPVLLYLYMYFLFYLWFFLFLLESHMFLSSPIYKYGSSIHYYHVHHTSPQVPLILFQTSTDSNIYIWFIYHPVFMNTGWILGLWKTCSSFRVSWQESTSVKDPGERERKERHLWSIPSKVDFIKHLNLAIKNTDSEKSGFVSSI